MTYATIEGKYLPSTSEKDDQPTEVLENAIQPETVENETDQNKQSVTIQMSKKKKKKLARQNLALLVNTRVDQERIFNEMKGTLKILFTEENTYETFLKVIDNYRATSESQIFLKSVHWIQNEMNKYLAESRSVDDEKNNELKFISSFTASDGNNDDLALVNVAETGLAISSSYITDSEKMLTNIDDLITKLMQKRNAEELIRSKFAQIKEILISTTT